MPIKVVCQCGQGFAAKEELAGRTLKCPKCGWPLKIPPPEQPIKGPEPHPQRDAVADLLDEYGIDESASPNVCPGCGTAMPRGAIVCINCGYNQKLGRKMVTEVVPAGPPARDQTARRTGSRVLLSVLCAIVGGFLGACLGLAGALYWSTPRVQPGPQGGLGVVVFGFLGLVMGGIYGAVAGAVIGALRNR